MTNTTQEKAAVTNTNTSKTLMANIKIAVSNTSKTALTEHKYSSEKHI